MAGLQNSSLWIYEVNAKVDRSIEKEYGEEVQRHIDAITGLPGIIGVKWFEQHDNTVADKISWVLQYSAVSNEAIENYFQTLAPTLRVGTAKFGSQVEVYRRVLKPLKEK